MYEVEFHITAPAYFLPVLLLWREGHGLSFLYDGQVGGQECFAAGHPKIEPKLYVLVFCRAFIIVKDAANTAALFITMPVYEIVVAVFFKGRVKSRIKRIAGAFIGLMKMTGIFIE